MGTNRYPSHDAAEVIRLRIYQLQYGCPCEASSNPKVCLRLIATGSPADARGRAANLELFETYWLDAAPQPRSNVPTSRTEPERRRLLKAVCLLPSSSEICSLSTPVIQFLPELRKDLTVRLKWRGLTHGVGCHHFRLLSRQFMLRQCSK